MRFKARFLVVAAFLTGLSIDSGMAQGFDGSCPYAALRQEGVQQYQRMYAASLLRELPNAKLSFPPDQQKIAAKDLLQPIYDFMVRTGWPTTITEAVSQVMDHSDDRFAACFPDLAAVQQPMQRRLDQFRGGQREPSLSVEGTPQCDIRREYLRIGSHQQVVAILEGPKMQSLAKRAAEQLTITSENMNPLDPNLEPERLANAFRERMHAAASGAGRDITPVLGWTGGNVPRSELLSCFPAFAALSRAVEARANAARENAARDTERKKAEASLPVNVLATAYASYIDVKRCHDARLDYLQGYITTSEMDESRSAVRQIEMAVRPKLGPSLTPEQVWTRVEQTEAKNFIPSREFNDYHRHVCRERLSILLTLLRQQVPESTRLRKDF